MKIIRLLAYVLSLLVLTYVSAALFARVLTYWLICSQWYCHAH